MDICTVCHRPFGRRRYILELTEIDEGDVRWDRRLELCRNCTHGVLDALEPPKKPARRSA